ncbi:hypothetical protein C2E23DRAFT_125157 [Lenzites betulinus]|nr:hypothetical protein C2E23DRAFT_125157 [Lenzites betulinus]
MTLLRRAEATMHHWSPPGPHLTDACAKLQHDSPPDGAIPLLISKGCPGSRSTANTAAKHCHSREHRLRPHY